MINQNGIELLTETARNEQLKKHCEERLVPWFASGAINGIMNFLDTHPTANQLSLHPKFSADLIAYLLQSGSFMERKSITIPQLLYHLLCHALYVTRLKEAGPAKRDETNCLTNRSLRDLYQNELFFCEMLAFHQNNSREKVIQRFNEIKLSLNELVLKSFNFLNQDQTDFSDPLWKQFFLSRYIAHTMQLDPHHAQYKDLTHWISENNKNSQHLNVWQFATWTLLDNQAYQPLQNFHRFLFEGLTENEPHSIAVFDSCQEGIQFILEKTSLVIDDTSSHVAKLNSIISHIDRYDYNQLPNGSPVMKVFRFTVSDKKGNGANNNASSSSKMDAKK